MNEEGKQERSGRPLATLTIVTIFAYIVLWLAAGLLVYGIGRSKAKKNRVPEMPRSHDSR